MQGKRILLGVTGGIAAYKSADLVRRLRDRGAEVQVVMTQAAGEFITATTFQALSGRPVRNDLWDAAAEAAMGHIELARWAELVIVAPASADFLVEAGDRPGERSAHHAVSRHGSADRGRPGDEPGDVGEPRHAGERRHPRVPQDPRGRPRRRASRRAAKSAKAACSSRSKSSTGWPR